MRLNSTLLCGITKSSNLHIETLLRRYPNLGVPQVLGMSSKRMSTFCCKLKYLKMKQAISKNVMITEETRLVVFDHRWSWVMGTLRSYVFLLWCDVFFQYKNVKKKICFLNLKKQKLCYFLTTWEQHQGRAAPTLDSSFCVSWPLTSWPWKGTVFLLNFSSFIQTTEGTSWTQVQWKDNLSHWF